MRIATVNVNGVRAAVRRGMNAWVAERRPELLCLQEVRATDAQLADALGGWCGPHQEAAGLRGRAGVAVLSRTPPRAVRAGLDAPGGEFADDGRWVEAEHLIRLDGAERPVTVVSAYVHTGEAGTPRQEQKERFLARAAERLGELAAHGEVVLTGDLNIAHREADLKNWKGNRGKAGFLPSERAWLDGVLAAGFVDVVRAHAGDVAGPYSWWSWRGTAFDNDAGWRIDYQLATAALAATVTHAAVDRAPSYAQRWSDHAPVVVEYHVDLVP